MFVVITGNGKGKTTSAIGQAIRTLGQGGRVFMVQFIKSDKFPSGEDKILSASFPDQMTFIKGGLGFVGILGDDLPKSAHIQAAQKTLSQAATAISSKYYQLIILDEINIALDLGLISKDELISILPSKTSKSTPEIIFTGRHAPDWLLSMADIITSCEEVKHSFNSGAPAKRGLEF